MNSIFTATTQFLSGSYVFGIFPSHKKTFKSCNDVDLRALYLDFVNALSFSYYTYVYDEWYICLNSNGSAANIFRISNVKLFNKKIYLIS